MLMTLIPVKRPRVPPFVIPLSISQYRLKREYYIRTNDAELASEADLDILYDLQHVRVGDLDGDLGHVPGESGLAHFDCFAAGREAVGDVEREATELAPAEEDLAEADLASQKLL